MFKGYGAVLFTGMPGSGKTTLSYMLCHASDENIKVIFVKEAIIYIQCVQ